MQTRTPIWIFLVALFIVAPIATAPAKIPSYRGKFNSLPCLTPYIRQMDPDAPKSRAMPHGLRALRDGSLVVNFKDCDVMGRLDACGNAVWASAGLYHHEFGLADDGSIWVWRGEESVHSQTQYLVNFDAQSGETIREIRFLDDVIKLNDHQTTLFAVSDDFSAFHFKQDPKDEDHDIFVTGVGQVHCLSPVVDARIALSNKRSYHGWHSASSGSRCSGKSVFGLYGEKPVLLCTA